MSQRVELLPEAGDDIHTLPAQLRREVVRLLVTLEQNPYLEAVIVSICQDGLLDLAQGGWT